MPLNDNTQSRVYTNSGCERRIVFEGTANEAVPPTLAGKDRFFILLHWAPDYTFLKLSIRTGSIEAIPGFDGLGRQLPIFGTLGKEALNKEVIRGRQFVCATMNANDRLVIEAAIDTTNESFGRLQKDRRVVTEVKAIVIAASAPPMQRRGQQAEVIVTHDKTLDGMRFKLTFEPAENQPEFRGVIAVDFGNTSSALVYLPRNERQGKAPKPTCLQYFAVGEDKDLVSSIIHLASIGAGDRHGEIPLTAADETIATIGRVNIALVSGHLELGAKRQVVSPDSQPPLRARFERADKTLEDVEFARSLPAEIFLRELLTKFRKDENARPLPLVATYPTTYTRVDEAKYKKALANACRRAIGDPKLSENDAVKLMIDEASAACFHHMFHDLIERAGGLHAARYLYPRGLNVLIFDCGGGSTDLALLHVAFYPEAEGGAGRVDLKVLGRSGDRIFGGDLMTKQAFRLLKYALAKLVNDRLNVTLGTEPYKANDWPKFLEDNETNVEQCMNMRWAEPNTGRPMSLSDDRVKIRRDAVALLWEYAEQVKLATAGGQSQGALKNATSNAPLSTIKAIGKLDEFTAVKHEDIIACLGGAVNADRLNALIETQLRRSLKKTNLLMEDLPNRLKKDEHNIPSENRLPVVHRVYVVGKASRYPAVEEALMTQLSPRVRFRNTRCILRDERKLVVASGASRALACMLKVEKRTVQFDYTLADKLPYDITIWDASRQQDEVLYWEDTRTAQINEKEIDIPTPKPGERPPEVLVLQRRWPGERRGEAFFEFPFTGGVRGIKVKLSFNKATQRFTMQDARNTPVEGIPVYDAEYVSPPQSGLL